MNKLTKNYNKTKILKYLSMALILLVILGLIMFNSDYLATREPSKTARHRWVGQLFYMRENLLFFVCLTLNFIFSLLFLDLVFMLIRGKLELLKEKGVIYKNGKYLVNQDDIEKIELFNYKSNSTILIYLKTTKNVLNNQESYFAKLKVKILLFINKKKIQIRLTFLDEDRKTYSQISSFIKK